MKRDIWLALEKWRQQAHPMPILLRGARQVGKSFIIQKFGEHAFQSLVSINFELQPELKACFESLEPDVILRRIFDLTRQKVEPGKTLLFLDEIQECPQAIKALRYFKEKCATLHVIGAGSLLEFVLNDADFRMPVGRVQSYYLYPLSFREFLMANKEIGLLEYTEQVHLNSPLEPAYHQRLLLLLQEYYRIGGMPAVVSEYIDNKDYQSCQMIQAALLNTYRNDFGKYASHSKNKYLQRLFECAPNMVAQHFKYVNVDSHMQSRDLKVALQALCDAGLISQIFQTNAAGIPVNVGVNFKKFKLLFIDIGLVKYTSRLSAKALQDDDLQLINQGRLSEQFVGQELKAYSRFYEPSELFYWARDKPGSTAEVDYIIQVDNHIIPIEVKSGKTGRMKSLRIFMAEKSAPIAVRISKQPLGFDSNILSVPHYLIHQIERLVQEVL